jgi:predicted RNA-binding Zn-ribbon protein involved in translation (DUF1610 family)
MLTNSNIRIANRIHSRSYTWSACAFAALNILLIASIHTTVLNTFMTPINHLLDAALAVITLLYPLQLYKSVKRRDLNPFSSALILATLLSDDVKMLLWSIVSPAFFWFHSVQSLELIISPVPQLAVYFSALLLFTLLFRRVKCLFSLHLQNLLFALIACVLLSSVIHIMIDPSDVKKITSNRGFIEIAFFGTVRAIPFGLLSVLLLLYIPIHFRLRRKKYMRQKRCLRCAYPLTSNQPPTQPQLTCPECGAQNIYILSGNP